MREGGAKGKTTEGRRGRVDVKESMTYCAAGRLEPASRVGDMLLRATSRSQPALFAPRPLPPLPFLVQSTMSHPFQLVRRSKGCRVNFPRAQLKSNPTTMEGKTQKTLRPKWHEYDLLLQFKNFISFCPSLSTSLAPTICFLVVFSTSS